MPIVIKGVLMLFGAQSMAFRTPDDHLLQLLGYIFGRKLMPRPLHPHDHTRGNRGVLALLPAFDDAGVGRRVTSEALLRGGADRSFTVGDRQAHKDNCQTGQEY